jgi:alkylation response protein AidB-like acyl-CoA dehydrogenase
MVGEALAIATSCPTHGVRPPLIEHQSLRWKLADIAGDPEGARHLTYRAADLVAQVAMPCRLRPARKRVCAELATRCLPKCMQVLGANGLRSDYPIARHMLAAKIAVQMARMKSRRTESAGSLPTDEMRSSK